MIGKAIIKAMQAHAEREYPRESCGFLIQNDAGETEYLPQVNHSTKPGDQFVIKPECAMAAEEHGKLLAVVHSHPDGPEGPSPGDQIACNAGSLPWYIIPVFLEEGVPRSRNVIGIAPKQTAVPLMGRPFLHGVLDCYSLGRDWFMRERGVVLPDHPRADEWWARGENLYVDNLARDGWRVLAEGEALQPGDMILMQIGSDVPNHAAFYMGSEQLSEGPTMYPLNEAIIHHFYGRPSERVLYGGMWKHCTAMVARHESQEK